MNIVLHYCNTKPPSPVLGGLTEGINCCCTGAATGTSTLSIVDGTGVGAGTTVGVAGDTCCAHRLILGYISIPLDALQ